MRPSRSCGRLCCSSRPRRAARASRRPGCSYDWRICTTRLDSSRTPRRGCGRRPRSFESSEAAADELPTALVGHGQVLLELGAVEAAESVLSEALEIWTQVAGPDSLEAAEVLSRLALGRDAAGDPIGAADVLAEALRIRRKRLGAGDPGLAPLLVQLGQLLFVGGQLDESLRALAEAEAIAAGIGDASLLGTLYGVLGQVHEAMGSPGEAERALQRSVALFEDLGQDQPELPVALSNLGHLLAAIDRLGESEVMLRRAADLFHRQNGEHDPAVAAAYADLGMVSRKAGRLPEAREWFEACLRLRLEAPERSERDVAAALNNLGVVEKGLGQLDRAEAHYVESLEVCRTAFGPSHPALGIPLGNLASLQQARGHLVEAEGLLVEALERLGPRPPGEPRADRLRRRLRGVRSQLKEIR